MARPKVQVSRFLVDGRVPPFGVIVKKAMWRGGRQWSAGVHIFDTPEKIDELGEPEAVAAMLDTLALYPDDFEIKTAAAAEKEPPNA